MQFGKSHWRTFEQGIEKEWLLTNGVGGFASSTIIGANSRRYHGLLVASLNPPVDRHLVLSKIDESISLNNKSYDIYSFKTNDYTANGHYYLQRFVLDPLPTYIYSIEDIFIEKTIALVHGENTVAVVYHIRNGMDNIKLRLSPLVNFRDYHSNSSKWHMVFDQTPYCNGTYVKPYNMELDINLYCSEGRYVPLDDCWFYNMDYPVERERGLHSAEDHYIPGYFEIEAAAGEEKYVTLIATVEKELKQTDGLALLKKEIERLDKLVKLAGCKDELGKRLVMAADNFIVHRKSTGGKTIIAGYPWFTDWGRDTMIAFTGLTLTTRRFDDAREILYTFSRYVKDGLVPNMFPDAGNEPPYNSVDASLLYFEAVYKYLQYTGDVAFVKEHIYLKLKEIVDFFIKGTHFNIRMDTDYLIAAGDEGTQLTWMDAKVGDWVVTPRHGKAVEINALWYNALKIMAKLAAQFGEDGLFYENTSEKVKNSFIKVFWNPSRECLYDVITGNFRDDKIRPNQILSVSLTYPVLEGELAKKVVTRVWKELYTAYGLRSLSQNEKEYAGIYLGDQHRRDGAYHQGTVWTWPIGFFITAYLRVNGYSDKSRKAAHDFIEPFKDHLEDACLGSISEIFDGNEPLIPRGCFAQAWSVAEVLRAYVEEVKG